MKKYIYHFGIILLVVILFLTNYKPGTYLLGWDSVATDLNPWLGVKRAIFSVWQEYQSFGLVAGMAHASDLVRAFFILLASFILPQSSIRYFYHFLMVLLGGLGSLVLFNYLGIFGIYGFLGSVFYILNFGTVQYFYFPYEPFSHFFASLPWLIWALIGLIRETGSIKKKSLLIFFVINVLATPAFYVQTLFLVYLLVIGIFAIGLIWDIRNVSEVKKVFLIFSLIFIINSFWLLPQIYFLKTASHNVREAKISQLTIDVVNNQTKSRGSVIDFLTLKGFYFDLKDKSGVPYFKFWQIYLNQPIIALITIALIIFIVIGLFQKNSYKKYFLTLLFINMLFLLPNTPIFSQINLFLKKNDLWGQIFRNPFTKFIPLHSLVLSYFFALGFTKLKLSRLNCIFIFTLIVFYSFPAFLGYFTSPIMKVSLPSSYINLFDYFKNENKDKRIALFPEYTYWGWFFHRWGYDGSGFLWYGIEQPIVSRTFDVWSEKSESYFWQIRQAIMSEDINLFNSVLDKYDIDYLIFDDSLVPVASNYKAIKVETLVSLLENNPLINKIETFASINLYKFTGKTKPNKAFLKAEENIKNIGPIIKLTDKDSAFLENGDYISNQKTTYSLYYPFLDLQSNNTSRVSWKISDDNEYIYIITLLPDSINENYTLNSFNKDSHFSFFLDEDLKEVTISSQFFRSTNGFEVKIAKESLMPKGFNLKSNNDCQNNLNESSIKFENGLLSLKSSNEAKICFGYHFDSLPQKYGYLIKIKARNVQGDSLYFYLLDHTNKQGIVEDRLKNDVDYFVIPPISQDGIGYSINFENTSYRNIISENILESVEIYPFPYDSLKSLKFVGKPSQSNIIIHSQTFSPGWKAWVNGQELKDHVLVNNWANGWKINRETCNVERGTCQINIIFWPQYLEFLGFGLMLLGLIYILKYKS